MDAERSERKPAGSALPASVRKIRGINTDTPQVNRLLRRLPKASLYRSDRYKAYSVLPLGSPDARGYSKRLYMLVGSLAMAPLRDGLHQRQLV